jgi:uncharacterized protein (DUF58 family)
MLSEDQIEEMMARVRKLELKARRLVRESFSGEYRASFRGQGLDFEDFREYQHGDEVRFIDWNVTARMNQAFVRVFREERELVVIIAVDVSGSTDYGSHNLSKREMAAEAAAILGFSALQNGDKVGLLAFADAPLLFVPPAKGSRHLLRLVREILTTNPTRPGTSIKEACDFLVRTLRRRALVILISDFHADPLERPLGKLARKHEVIALQVSDPLEARLPKAGKVIMVDPETAHETLVDTSNAKLRTNYEQLTRRHREGLASILKKHAIDSAKLSTTTDPLPALHQLLKRHGQKQQ